MVVKSHQFLLVASDQPQEACIAAIILASHTYTAHTIAIYTDVISAIILMFVVIVATLSNNVILWTINNNNIIIIIALN